MGVRPTSLHMFCGFGVRPCTSGAHVGGAPRVKSLVRIAGSNPNLSPVTVGLRQGCPLSPILFITYVLYGQNF